jgi:hypothetical protein
MKLSAKLGAVAAIGSLAVAVPAIAKPAHPTHPTTPKSSHKCTAHEVAYIASGTIVSWAATKNSDGTWSGAITVHVTRTNHHAKSDKGKDTTYTLTNAKVRLGHGVTNPPVAGDRVKVLGKVSSLAKKCDQTGFTPMVTVRQVIVHAAAKK